MQTTWSVFGCPMKTDEIEKSTDFVISDKNLSTTPKIEANYNFRPISLSELKNHSTTSVLIKDF